MAKLAEQKFTFWPKSQKVRTIDDMLLHNTNISTIMISEGHFGPLAELLLPKVTTDIMINGRGFQIPKQKQL